LRTFMTRAFCDMHVHLREGLMLDVVLETAKYSKHCLVMPNTTQPLLTVEDVLSYRTAIKRELSILSAAKCPIVPGFTPHVALYVNEETTPEMIHDAADAEVIAGKIYPKGRTTGSDHGVTNYEKLKPALRAMEGRNMVCCLHGEHPEPHPNLTVLEWESEFVSKIFPRIVGGFPKLRVVLEHITTNQAVHAVIGSRVGVAATITAHHLSLTIDDILADGIRPHNYCKPIAKYPRDLTLLQKVVFEGHRKFFLGSDSAPHSVENKESASGCAGCFTAAHLPNLVARFYDNHDPKEKASWNQGPPSTQSQSWHDDTWIPPGMSVHPRGHKIPSAINRFVADNAMSFYQLPEYDETLEFTEEEFEVPSFGIYGGTKVNHFAGGQTLDWVVK